MAEGTPNLDSVIEDLGCGLLQVTVVAIIFFVAFPPTWNLYFMTFGLYNPGWRCLDNTTTTSTTSANLFDGAFSENITDDYITDSCAGFDTCQNVVFNPAASTVATEFGLICGRSWVMSLMISLFMVGNVVTYVFVGIAGDKFGRKVSIQVSALFLSILSLVSIFSSSWQMFAAVEFLLGCCTSFGTLVMVYTNEMVPRSWRIRVCCMPSWTVGIAVFALIAMLVEDWKVLRLTSCAVSGAAFLVMFWTPKTPRFLTAMGKRKEFQKLMETIAKYNKTEVPQESCIDLIIKANKEEGVKKRPFPIFSLFRKGYKLKTFVIGLSFVIMDMTYFAMQFGVSALPGDMYQNMLILSISELPSNLIASVVGNVFGRRVSVLVFTVLGSLCLFGVSGVDLLTFGSTRTVGTLVLLVVAKIFLNTGWYVLATAILEIYPTVARSTVNSYARMASMLGGVLAPYLVPSDPATFYISFLVMGGMMFFAGFLVLLLPETKGKALPNDWTDIEIEIKGKEVNSSKQDKNAIV